MSDIDKFLYNGCWVVYGWDSNPYVDAIFGDEMEARRYADGLGYHMEVLFVPWGEFKP